jgi:ribosomal protein L11 methyltransferase
MNWLEITLAVDEEAAEAVSEVLSRYAPNGVAIEQRARDLSARSGRGDEAGFDWSPDGPLESTVVVRAYLPVDSEVEAKQRQIAEGLWHLRQIVPMPEPTLREVQPGDWENAWKEHYHVLRVGPRFVIRPSWREHAPQPGDVVIELDPGMAFGTGLHPTTQMCLQAIERHMPAGARVIDLGTGSGILAIAAARLGAASALALDVDPVAVEAARENARRNRVEHVVRIEAGSLAAAQAQPAFDFALVNILAKTIVQLCEAGLAEIVRPGGVIVLAGLIESQESEVREALARAGLTVFDRIQDKDWVGLVCWRADDVTRSPEQPGRRGSGT